MVELLTVITIIAILAGITIGAIAGVKQRSLMGRARADLAALVTALEGYKQLYGDYPQLGEFAQASATPTAIATGPGLSTPQAKLFNCLTGVFGPKAFTTTDRISGPNFLDVGKFPLNGTLANTFQVPAIINASSPPVKVEQNVCLLDPWGRRYIYYYKTARNPTAWQAPGYILYSAGATVAANGTQAVPINPMTGIFLTTQTAEVADNIYANP